MKSFKVGDKVIYNGERATVTQVPEDGTTPLQVGWIHEDYVALDLSDEIVYPKKDLKHYKSPHERLLEQRLTFLHITDKNPYKAGKSVYMYVKDTYDEEGEYICLVLDVANREISSDIFSEAHPETRGYFMSEELIYICLDYFDWVRDYPEEVKEALK